jgi:small-conductance mechanosensitive channel
VVQTSTAFAVWGLRTRAGRDTPKILRDVINAALYVVALTVALRATLKVDLGGLVATSAVLSVVIGLALQEPLGNLFAGLSLQLETPFRVGDWITVGPHCGRVLQVAWRATRIQTVCQEQVTIPNSVIAKESVINHSRGNQGVGLDLSVEVDYDSPPNAVRAALLGLLAAHPKVLGDPAPLVRLGNYGASGIEYQVRFFTRSFDDLADLASELRSQLWYRMRREGFSFPFPTRTVYLQQGAGGRDEAAEREELTGLLAEVDFLRPIGAEGIARLAGLARTAIFGRDEVVLRQGERGESFFLIMAGEVSVRANGVTSEIARLRRGDFFGEMSLLNGEPRSATVVAATDAKLLCLGRDGFADLLAANEQLARAVAEVLARRSAELRERVCGDERGEVSLESNRILGRLREIFRIG